MKAKHYNEGGDVSKSNPKLTTIGKTVTSKRRNVLPDHFCLREDDCKTCREWINNHV